MTKGRARGIVYSEATRDSLYSLWWIPKRLPQHEQLERVKETSQKSEPSAANRRLTSFVLDYVTGAHKAVPMRDLCLSIYRVSIPYSDF